MIVYATKTIKAIAPVSARKVGTAYCNGRRDFSNMGIAVICAYDYTTETNQVFLRDNFHSFQKLLDDTDMVIGFNILDFDNELLMANGFYLNPNTAHFDVQKAIWSAALGHELGTGPSTPQHAGYGLNDCTMANFGGGILSASHNPQVMWQHGRIGVVVNYCLNDIRLIKKLVDKIIEMGEVVNPKEVGKTLCIEFPELHHGF